MTAQFDNQDRTRYYGKRVGDRVEYRSTGGLFPRQGEVVGYGFMDNNRVRVIWDGEKLPVDWVAEWLTIIEKVEDRKKASE